MRIPSRQNHPGAGAHDLILLLGFALLAPAVCAEEPAIGGILTVDTHRVLLPTATAPSLDDGRLAADPARGAYAVAIQIRPPEPDRPWVLRVRSEAPTFQSEGSGKPCHDLWWKFDREGSGAFRPVEHTDAVVLEKPSGGSAEATLDLRIDLDWSTPPGIYELGLVFTLVFE
jgi:hypothetical protein